MTRFGVSYYVQSKSSFNLELSPRFTCKFSRVGNYYNLSYKQFVTTTQNRKLLLLTRLWRFFCAHDALQRLFGWLIKSIYKTKRLSRICTAFFYTQLIITVRQAFIHTHFVQQLSFPYSFRAICCKFDYFRKRQCFILLHYSMTWTMLYVWKNTD